MDILSTFALIIVNVVFASYPEATQSNRATISETTIPVSQLASQQRAKWNGTVSRHLKATGTTGTREDWADISFVDGVGTGTVRGVSEGTDLSGAQGTYRCSGSGPASLHKLVINKEDKTLDFEIIAPPCKGTMFPHSPEGETWIVSPSTYSIANDDNALAGKVLSGNTTVTGSIPGVVKKVVTVTWSLVNGPIDAELIVTPSCSGGATSCTYDNWLPEPGRDELLKGSAMKIALNVQGRNGQPSTLKAERFELKLSNTSREPGITLNFPLSPRANQMPDLRFLKHRIGESIEEDQSITVNSADGKTGETYVASYDGGGWSTLTAEAVLKGGMRIKGHLLVSGGREEIDIPKRYPAKKMAASWLDANGNPGSLDDKDRSTGNTNLGDGLTAYEEYRGFWGFQLENGAVSGPKFFRLDPRKKELGLRIKGDSNTSELPLFSEGIGWFKRASGIEPVIFSEKEIGDDRRLNKNFTSFHNYDQYVIKLEKGDLPDGVAGENQPNDLIPMFPAQSLRVVIDFAEIDAAYERQARALPANMQMPYTKTEERSNTVAHEMAHSVNVVHHGRSSAEPPRKAYAHSQPPYRIYWWDGIEETVRPYPEGANVFLESVGTDGNDSSGDLSCIMAYTNNYEWAFRIGTDRSLVYRKLKLLPVGKMFCTKKDGTGINTCPSQRTGGTCPDPQYFGDATFGDCLGQFKLKP